MVFSHAAFSLLLLGLPFQGAKVDRGDRIQLPAGEYKLEKLVDLASDSLQLSFLVGNACRGNLGSVLTFTTDQEFTKKEYRSFFERVLLNNAYTLIPLEGIDGAKFQLVDLRAMPQNRVLAAQHAVFVPSGDLAKYDGRAVLVSSAFELKHIGAQHAQASLRQLINDQNLERVFNQGNTVIAVGYPHTLLQFGEILRLSDAPMPEDREAEGVGRLIKNLEKKIQEFEERLAKLEGK